MFEEASFCYWLLAVVVSVYHAARGCRVYYLMVEKPLAVRDEKYHDGPLSEQGGLRRFRVWKPFDKVTLLYFQTFLVWFIFSMAGFVALLAAHNLWPSGLLAPIDAGRAGLIGFLSLFGVVGVSGELPPLVQRGRLSLGG